jgi:crotonobetainyl-CoA:carnitine CoA-transferase CaiB-like acyl-CoA transferase
VLRLIASADVLVYNVRPQAMARLQLGYEAVSQVNPRLIYAGVRLRPGRALCGQARL